ncbi:hypothetical protein, partial [Aeromonas rivipollensis]|uniref:hypothetical protein n=1 Tax=Aeromonas rivipollensis TaxID=948519 RepID=UPI003D209AE0
GYHQSAVGHLSPFIHECRTYYLNSRTTLSIMKKHEEYYSDGRNWNSDDDYRTLLTAVAELNGAMEGLNRIA